MSIFDIKFGNNRKRTRGRRRLQYKGSPQNEYHVRLMKRVKEADNSVLAMSIHINNAEDSEKKNLYKRKKKEWQQDLVHLLSELEINMSKIKFKNFKSKLNYA